MTRFRKEGDECEIVYMYSFGVRPAEDSGLDQAVFSLFRMFPRIQMAFTKTEFERFRFGLKSTKVILPLPRRGSGKRWASVWCRIVARDCFRSSWCHIGGNHAQAGI